MCTCMCDTSQLEPPHTVHCQPVWDVGFVGTPVSSVCLIFWASSVYSSSFSGMCTCMCDKSHLERPHTVHCQPVLDVGFVGTPVSSVCLRFWASSVTVAFQVCVHVCVIYLSLSLHTLYTVSLGFVGTPVSSVCLRFWASSVTVVAFQVRVHVCVIHLSLSLHTLYTVSLSEMWASLVHLYHQSVLDFGLRHVFILDSIIFHYSKFFKALFMWEEPETGDRGYFSAYSSVCGAVHIVQFYVFGSSVCGSEMQ